MARAPKEIKGGKVIDWGEIGSGSSCTAWGQLHPSPTAGPSPQKPSNKVEPHVAALAS